MKEQRKIVIGDIHGCFDELVELLRETGITDDDLLISVGDIVDRGNNSKRVFEYLRSRPNTIVLMGNHERKHLNGVLSYAQDIVKVQFGDDYDVFLKWVDSLHYYYETDEAIIVHAALEHDLQLPDQKPEVLCGSTAGERFLEKKYGPDTHWVDHYKGQKPVIYGHHVVGSQPEIKNNTYGIDTGACHGGWLTAIELPGFIVHQVRSITDHWSNEQKEWQLPVLASKDWINMDLGIITKQLNKLSFVEDLAVKKALQQLNVWVYELEEQLPALEKAIDDLTRNILKQNPNEFNAAVSDLYFKTFLYKSRAGNLKLTDLQNTLNTPSKITALTKALGLPAISLPDIASN